MFPAFDSSEDAARIWGSHERFGISTGFGDKAIDGSLELKGSNTGRIQKRKTNLPKSLFRLATRCRSIQTGHVRTHALPANNSLFDHLVGGGKQQRWNSKPERLGGLEIYGQLEFRRRLYRKLARLLTAEDAIDIPRSVAVLLNDAG